MYNAQESCFIPRILQDVLLVKDLDINWRVDA